jgi:hypothetical protein
MKKAEEARSAGLIDPQRPLGPEGIRTRAEASEGLPAERQALGNTTQGRSADGPSCRRAAGATTCPNGKPKVVAEKLSA